MNLLILIPTLNEVKNVSILTKKILFAVNYAEILFVDDNSNDGTREEILKLAKNNKKIKFIFRDSKLGIGSAHKAGITWAKKKKYKKLITMDSDGTHNPIYLPKMIKRGRSFQIVNTNRFGKRNSLKDWSFIRKLVTTTRHFLIKNLLNLKFDSSGGYRFYNLEKINLSHILEAKHNGYSFLWESLYLLKKNKYTISEIDVLLPSRTLGRSKMRVKDVLDGFAYLIWMLLFRRLFK